MKSKSPYKCKKKRILTSHDYVDESSDLAWSQILIIQIRNKYVIAITITVVVITSVGVRAWFKQEYRLHIIYF